jgi:hypothetical protein
MTRYETIINLGDDFIKLMGKSLIPVHVLDWKVYYEAYLKETELQRQRTGKTRKTLAACMVAETYSISERNVFNIIAFMEGA